MEASKVKTSPSPSGEVIKSSYGEMGRHFPYEDELRRLEKQQEQRDFDKVNNKDYKGANNQPVVHNISEFTVKQDCTFGEVISLEEYKDPISEKHGYSCWANFYAEIASKRVSAAYTATMYEELAETYAQQFKDRIDELEYKLTSSQVKADALEQENLLLREFVKRVSFSPIEEVLNIIKESMQQTEKPE